MICSRLDVVVVIVFFFIVFILRACAHATGHSMCIRSPIQMTTIVDIMHDQFSIYFSNFELLLKNANRSV